MQALKNVHVNLVQLVTALGNGEKVRTFNTNRELVEWTKKSKKSRIFPLAAAKEDGFIKIFLRKL